MSIPRGIAPVRLDKSKLALCKSCREKKLASGADILASCKGCGKSVFSQLWYCRKCAEGKNTCQLCPRSLKPAPAEQTTPAAGTRKGRAASKISLIYFLKQEGKKNSQSWEDYAATYANTVTEGAGIRERKLELATIRISRSPRIDVEERRQINALLSEHGYGQETRDLTIGEIYRLAKEQESERKKHKPLCRVKRLQPIS